MGHQILGLLETFVSPLGLQLCRSYVNSKLKEYPQFQVIAHAISKSGFKVRIGAATSFRNVTLGALLSTNDLVLISRAAAVCQRGACCTENQGYNGWAFFIFSCCLCSSLCRLCSCCG